MAKATLFDQTRPDQTRPDQTDIHAQKYDDFAVGQSATFTRSITPEMMRDFRELSGDTNPLHNDEQFAHSKCICLDVIACCTAYMQIFCGLFLWETA